MIISDLLKYFFEGAALGVAAGVSCAVFCIPVMIGLASRNPNNITPVVDFLFFLLGRLIAYLFIAVFFSYIGMKLSFIDSLKTISKIIISILLIIWGVKGFIRSDKEESSCRIKKFTKAVPFIAGILTGISPCPPFIAGITRIFDIGNVLFGVIYFLGFYFTTTIVLLPALSTALIKYKKELKILASLVSIIFGVVFLFIGIFGFIK